MEVSKNILVLGAGVSGLSTGILLLKKRYNVTIWAKDLPPHTTSNKAAAVWYPYLCNPREKALPWGKETFRYFQTEMIPHPESGCIEREVTELFDTPQQDPWWKDAIPTLVERPSKEELPEGYVDGYRIQSIVIDTSIYMDYLMNQFQEAGGTIIQKEITDMKEAFQEFEIVVNCTGLGSKELCNDLNMYPVRGQMVKIKKGTVTSVTIDDEGPNSLSLVVPRVNDIMLGGTVQENDWNIQEDPKDTEDILRKASLICPDLKDIEVLSVSVGLRPMRNEIRLEKENIDGKTLIHNYGHGGSGFTLSWGCAKDVVSLIEQL